MRRLFIFSVATLAMTGFFASETARADEWEQASSYYEDDAWYDVSEWFDGNDYNPTDEVVGRWDNEQYDWTAIESDADNDSQNYGYDKRSSSDDWFYDYYDNDYVTSYDYLDDSLYRRSYEYFDFDNDGYFDGYMSFQDTDADGFYEEAEFVSFNLTRPKDSTKKDGQTADKQRKSSRGMEITGTIEKMKKVQARTGGDRLVVMVSTKENGEIAVDLGRANRFESEKKQDANQNADKSDNYKMPKEGDKVTARGPLANVGDKKLLVAQSVKIADGRMRNVDRATQSFSGKVAKLKTVQVRGQDRQLAIVNLDSGKKTAVDLGSPKDLQSKLKEGDQIQISGLPAKVKDRSVVIAHSVTIDGERKQIDRSSESKNNKGKAATSS